MGTTQDRQSVFAGEVVVFVGRLSTMPPRAAQTLVTQGGGRLGRGITPRTTLVVVGSDVAAATPAEGDVGQHWLERAARVNAARPNSIAIITEDEFCRRAQLDEASRAGQELYPAKTIRSLYPAIKEPHLRFLERWGLIRSASAPGGERAYPFASLRVIRETSAELERGVSFRAVLRALAAARAGQLELDFQRVGRDVAQAKVVDLRDRPRRAGGSPTEESGDAAVGPTRTLAVRYFLEGSALDGGDAAQREAAMAAYRRALMLDPQLVPAFVNLANLHYAQDALIEAQALYEQALQLDPGCFEAQFNLGNVHHDLGRYREACRYYAGALEANALYAEAHFYLAVTLEKLGCSAEAKPHWRAYQELAPDGEWVDLAREFSD